ncbi:agmatinase [candidate division WOR-3 bacterium]|nr:agmatinase [candidate division WOR-3 bacterium]
MSESVPYNFGGLSDKLINYKYAKIVVLPVPFDKTSSWIKGSDRGPKAIIEASMNMELYDIETSSEVYKKGIFTAEEILSNSSEEMIKCVYERVSELIKDGKFVLTLGGEHSISFPAIKAHHENYKDISILHLDAHTDMRDSYLDNKYSHACVMARVKEINNNIISIGIRSQDSSELKNIDKDNIFFARDIYNSEEWIEKAIGKLNKNVYISLDLDVFDPAVLPSTGTPEPGGLGWYAVIKLLKEVCKNRNLIGFDVVELCPTENKASDFLAAKLIYKLLSYKFYL